MSELRIRLAGSSSTDDDIVARFGNQTTIGQLVDELELRFDQVGPVPRSLQRISRGQLTLSRDTRLAQADLRSGDTVALAIDSGTRPVPVAAAVAHLRVVEGPDLNRVYELRRGESTIGRSARCDIRLNDNMASRRHAVIRVSDIVEVADAGSTNGIIVNDSEITGVHRLRPGDRLMIGDTVLLVEMLGGGHEAVDVVDNAVAFNRPPRIERPFQPVKIVLPAPLDPPPRQRLPLITAVVPFLMGGILYAITRNPASLAFVVLSPMMAYGSVFESRRSGRKDHADRRAEREAVLRDRIVELEQAYDAEVASRRRFSPRNEELLACVADLGSRLWEREPEDEDFLSLRLGLLPLPSQITVEVAQGGNREGRLEAERLAGHFAVLPPVPVTADARTEAPVGIAGPTAVTDGIVRSLVLQAAALHSPTELVIGALLPAERAVTWDWLKWLPHNARSLPGSGRSPNAVGRHEGVELLSVLNELLDARLAGDTGAFASEARAVHTPHVLLIVDGSTSVERSRFTRLLEHGVDAGISVLWMASDARRVPNASRTAVTVEPGGQTVTLGRKSSGRQLGGIPIEPVTLNTAEAAARALAPVVDIAADSGTAVELPATVNLVDLLGGLEILDNPTATIERWQESAPSGNRRPRLSAPVGVFNGGTLSIDLMEDGPHGLVGGTTGAGKSEFLQSFLAALAASHPPDRLNFLLVDYKGGSAFGDLAERLDRQGRQTWPGLHHTVGMITDLTPALVQRALVSLRAELTRREHILERNGEKDMVEMARHGRPDTPPSLLIVVDEFAALAREAPAFVDGVVDIAARGRSLGLHLLLATQKPGGVVTPVIQANTNLRVALRMATEDESTDVVGSPLAGRLDRRTPGRGVIRRGHSDLVAFQSAYVGGITTAASMAELQVGELSLAEIHWLTSAPGAEGGAVGADISDQDPTDLRRLVTVVNAAAAHREYPLPMKPWLDPLPPHVDLLDLDRPPDDQRFVFGVADLPHRQDRTLAQFVPDTDGSMLLYGMGGSGKTVALRSLAASLGLARNQAPVHVYALDFAGRGLELLDPLPHVGEVINGDDYERVTRLFKELRSEIVRRAQLFAEARTSSMGGYRTASPDGVTLPRLVILLDGYDNFTAAYDGIDRGSWVDLLPRLVADGRGVGVHFVLTGSRRTSFPMALSGLISTRLVFRMASSDDYHSVNADPTWFDQATPPGRCRLGDVEVQIAVLGASAETGEEARAFQRLGAALERILTPAPPIRVLPHRLTLDELPAPKSGLAWLMTEDFAGTGPDLTQNVLITGRPRSGKTTALMSLAAAARRNGMRPEIFAADPARCPVEGARDLAALVERVTGDPTGLVFVDGAERISGLPGDYAIQEAISSGRLRIVAAADSAAARSFDPIMKAVRARADVLLLQPDPDYDGDLLGQPVPRVARQFPAGRGYARLLDQIDVVHVALAP
ncbi:MAG: FtsK/SpoIIIE domain-containing protein [Acidimicrobiales bacterium]